MKTRQAKKRVRTGNIAKARAPMNRLHATKHLAGLSQVAGARSERVRATRGRSLSTTAELIRVKRHEFADAHRRPAGYPLHAVRQPVIPTRSVQLAHRDQMPGEVLRQPRTRQRAFPILGRDVRVRDLAVHRGAGGPQGRRPIVLAADHRANWKPAIEEQAGHGSPDRTELTGGPGDEDRTVIGHVCYARPIAAATVS